MVDKKSTALKIMQATLAWTPRESSSFIARMNQNSDAKLVGNALRIARKRRGYVMRQVAEAAGVTAGAVGNWERGANDMSIDNLRAVARFLQIDRTALSEGQVKFLGDDEPESLADAEIISDLGTPSFGPLDVEILGVVAGGDDGDFSLNGEVAGYARRPAGIANLRRVFALHLISTSMIPRYDPGELIYCGGREPVPGDHVVVEMHPDEEGAVGKAFVKKLIERRQGKLICEQYNPPSIVEFDIYRIKNLWRVIPTRELLGF